ncbi:MAG: hypothetical protein AAFX94_26155, partial [Myxococcota bacterium]
MRLSDEARERWSASLGSLCTRSAASFDQLLDLIHESRPDAIVIGWGDADAVERIGELVGSGQTVIAMIADPADGAARFLSGARECLAPDRESELPQVAHHCAEVSRAIYERD